MTKKEQKKESNLKWIILLWLVLLSPIAGIWGVMWLTSNEYFGNLPTIDELENPKSHQASEVYSADRQILGKYYKENRVNVGYSDISPFVIAALVATEDERYFNHSGIDFRSFGRVITGILTGTTNKGGGSTITQQLAKMLFTEKPANGFERVMQKLKEWIIAVRLERQYTKEEIITMYLNKFDFVNNAVGIKSASNVYFNKEPIDLNIAEAAMLVGMAKNPALFNPVRRPETTMKRRNVVYAQMLRNEVIQSEEFDSLKQDSIQLRFSRVDHKTGLAPYFREYLRGELRKILYAKNEETNTYLYAKPDGEPYDIYSDGLKIYTTIDSRLQKFAEDAVSEHIGGELQKDFFRDLKNKKNAPFDFRLSQEQVDNILWQSIKRTERYKGLKEDGASTDSIWKNFRTPVEMDIFSYDGIIDTMLSPLDSIRYYKSFLQVGMMSIEPATGFIKAWVGGVDFKYFSYDHVKQGRRQVGSTFKPFVYALAMQEGYSPCYEVPNIKTCFDMPDGQPDWCPKNSDDQYGGMVSLKYGLANSMNTVTAYVMKQFGPKAVINLARRMGITSPLDEVPALCLGVADISVFELVGANATFANKGLWIEPTFISRIEDKNGNVVVDFRPKSNEAMSEETAYIMLNLMQGVVDGVHSESTGKTIGTGVRLRFKYKFKNEIAGKTGTTQNNSDGWFVGITPDLVTGIWVGAEDRAIRFSRTYYGQGANTSLPIWALYMQKVYEQSEETGIMPRDFERPETPISVELDCKKYKKGEGNTIFQETYDFDDGSF